MAFCPNTFAAQLKKEFGATTYQKWLNQLNYCVDDSHCLTLSVPSKVVRNWIQTHYLDRIELLANAVEPHLQSVMVVVANDDNKPEKSEKTSIFSGLASSDSAVDSLTHQENKVFNISTHLDERFTFDSFIIGKPNELAFAAARRVAESRDAGFNPLFLYGGVGLGKTHLMHAIAHEIAEKTPDRTVLYLSAEKFMYQFVRALRSKETVSFKEQFRSVDVLMIDDVQFIAGKESTQEEFFHTFNALMDQNKQIILSADKSPNDLTGIEDRLKSRLGWGLVADIHPTTYELRLGILGAKRDETAHKVTNDVLEFLAHKITSNVRELEGAFNRILAYADLIGRPISVEMAEDVLQDVLRATLRPVTIDQIQKKICEHYAIRHTDLMSARRHRVFVRPRQIAMYLAKMLTTQSMPSIARAFGRRDHTTVMHATQKVEELIKTDPEFEADVNLLSRALRHV